MSPWLILTATLPTSPSGLRVRVWRALKATHCATLREGVYILPADAPGAAAFWTLDGSIRAGGAASHLLALTARDAAQDASFRALFDRSAQYQAFQQTLKEAAQPLHTAAEAEARRLLAGLDRQLHGILASDFFPGAPARKAQAALQALRAAVAQRLSPGEPAPAADSAPPLRSAAAHQGRTWATRARPWVDRLACAWLITRFIDRAPRFVWLADARDCPPDALGFDFDGAAFSHVGDRVSVEVLMAAFALGDRPGLQRLAALVHALDVGGAPLDEAPGLELLVRGLHALHADDDALLAAALPLFDTLLAGLALAPETPR